MSNVNSPFDGTQQTSTAGFENPNDTQNQNFLADIFNMFGSSTHASDSDAELEKVATAMREHIEARKQKDMEVVVVSNQLTGNYGAVVLCRRVKVNNENHVYGYISIVERAKQTDTQTHTMHLGTGTVEVFVSAADAYTKTYVDKVINKLQQHYGPSVTMANGGWGVIYRETSLEPADIGIYMAEAQIAMEASMNALLPKQDVFSLALLTGKTPIQVRSSIALDAKKKSPAGLPIRSDLMTTLSLSQGNMANRGMPTFDTQEMAICEATAYVDLLFTPQPGMGFGFGGGMMFNPMMMGAAPAPIYLPRINITNFALRTPKSSLEFMLLGVASIAALAKNRAYGVVWRDQFTQTGSVNKRNLGAVGLQAPNLSADGKPGILDIAGDVNSLYQVMCQTMSENPIFTLELTQGGQANWVTTIFARAANGDVRYQEYILAAANNLTCGKFADIYAKLQVQSNTVGAPVVTTSNDPSLIGTHVENGELRDIREVDDLLAIMNLIGSKHPDMVSRYLATQDPNIPVQQRMATRIELLKSIAHDVQIRAYSRKFDFGGLFIQALVQSINACGVGINSDHFMNQTAGSVYTQSIGNWQQNMVNVNAMTNLFQQQNMGNMQNGWNMGNMFSY